MLYGKADEEQRRPVILMSPDLFEVPDYPTEREYVVRTNYVDAVTDAGGMALIVPHQPDQVGFALAMADGILITSTGPGAEVAAGRIDFERMLVKGALATGIPVLGICHGMQLIGECLGGEIVRDIPHLLEPKTLHLPTEIPDRLAHDILIEPDSLLARWTGRTSVRVNSLHRHVLSGEGQFRIVARASDGVVEAIEGLGETLCLGVQWHPEYHLAPLDRLIFENFVARCAEVAILRVTATDRTPRDPKRA